MLSALEIKFSHFHNSLRRWFFFLLEQRAKRLSGTGERFIGWVWGNFGMSIARSSQRASLVTPDGGFWFIALFPGVERHNQISWIYGLLYFQVVILNCGRCRNNSVSDVEFLERSSSWSVVSGRSLRRSRKLEEKEPLSGSEDLIKRSRSSPAPSCVVGFPQFQ